MSCFIVWIWCISRLPTNFHNPEPPSLRPRKALPKDPNYKPKTPDPNHILTCQCRISTQICAARICKLYPDSSSRFVLIVAPDFLQFASSHSCRCWFSFGCCFIYQFSVAMFLYYLQWAQQVFLSDEIKWWKMIKILAVSNKTLQSVI